MAEKSSFFTSLNGDRRYKAEEFARYFSTFIGNGVFPNPSTNLEVVANGDMTLTLTSGLAWLNGYMYENTEDLTLTVSASDSALSRIDRLVIRCDYVNREIKAIVKRGVFASSPTPPSLERGANAYEISVADILVSNGVIAIEQSKITDTRLNSEACGIVTQTVETIDTTTLYNKLQGFIDERGQDVDYWLNQATATWEIAFNTWFDTIKGILQGDIAGELATRILELENTVNNLELTSTKVMRPNGKTVEQSLSDNETSILSQGKDIENLKQSVDGARQTLIAESNKIVDLLFVPPPPPQVIIGFNATIGENTLHLKSVGDGWDCVIDWGDGTTTSVVGSGGNITHNYSEAKIYDIKIIAPVKYGGLNVCNQAGKEKYVLYYSNVVQTSKSMTYMFYGCSNLTTIPQLDTSNVTSMSYMFNGCSKLTTIPQLNTSNVIDMSYMFNGCSNLTTIPTLNTNNVTSMGNMFSSCSNLTTIPTLNTNNVTSMGNMFSSCSTLTTIPTLDTNNVIDMSYMFRNCTNLTTIPTLDTSNVTNMGNMFNGCSNLTTIPQLDTSNVTNMFFMFGSCANLTTIPQLNTSNVTSMAYTFNGCRALTTIPQLDTNNVNNMSSMFDGSSNLTTIPTLDTSNVTNMGNMFRNCSNLTTPMDASSYWNNPKVTSYAGCFYNCTKIPNYAEIPASWK